MTMILLRLWANHRYWLVLTSALALFAVGSMCMNSTSKFQGTSLLAAPTVSSVECSTMNARLSLILDHTGKLVAFANALAQPEAPAAVPRKKTPAKTGWW